MDLVCSRLKLKDLTETGKNWLVIAKGREFELNVGEFFVDVLYMEEEINKEKARDLAQRVADNVGTRVLLYMLNAGCSKVEWYIPNPFKIERI